MKLSSTAKPSQEEKFIERRSTPERKVSVLGQDFIALQNVYDTSTDTELMVDVVEINKNQTFLEIGCGTGAISLLVGKLAKSGIAVDINPAAVKNANLNKKLMNVKNVEFILSNVFRNVKGKFDVIICNPPYSPYKPNDEVEMMFWDEENRMKIKFFNEVRTYLKPKGFVYFGYADFEDIDQDLPKRLAKKAGLKFVKRIARRYRDGDRMFFVYVFKI
jgi:release factor glutamine methyltransferase